MQSIKSERVIHSRSVAGRTTLGYMVRWVAVVSYGLLMGCGAESEGRSSQAVDEETHGKADDAETEGEFGTDDSQSSGGSFLNPSEPGELPPLPDGLEWTPCSDYGMACVSLPVPLDHERPDGRTITVEVGVTPSAGGPARGQVWMHQGGPGVSAEFFDVYATFVAEFGFDVFVLEHRGVGASTALECPDQMSLESDGGATITAAEVVACRESVLAQWGSDGLAAFSTTQAALDLQAALTMIGTEQPVFLYGVSYGTYWMLRFLDVATIEVDGVILDGVVPPGDLFLSERNDKTDRVVHRLAQACAHDETCFSHLGADPWKTAVDALAQVDEGACEAAGVSRGSLADLVYAMIARRQWGLVLPLMHRVARCSDDDVAAIRHAFQWRPAAGVDSPLVYYNVALSELWSRPGDPRDAVSCDGGEFCATELWAEGSAFVEHWPVYEEPLVGAWPHTDTPILAINGDLDVQTPLEEARGIESRGFPNLHFIEAPGAGHALLSAGCFYDVLGPFLTDPKSHPGECRDGHDVPLVATDAQEVFGVFDPYDGGPDAVAPALPRQMAAPTF